MVTRRCFSATPTQNCSPLSYAEDAWRAADLASSSTTSYIGTSSKIQPDSSEAECCTRYAGLSKQDLGKSVRHIHQELDSVMKQNKAHIRRILAKRMAVLEAALYLVSHRHLPEKPQTQTVEPSNADGTANVHAGYMKAVLNIVKQRENAEHLHNRMRTLQKQIYSIRPSTRSAHDEAIESFTRRIQQLEADTKVLSQWTDVEDDTQPHWLSLYYGATTQFSEVIKEQQELASTLAQKFEAALQHV